MGSRGIAIGTTMLVLLAGGAVVADRVAVGRAQDMAVTELRSTVAGVKGQPQVTIAGFPFLTQLLAGKLTDVKARADGLTLEGADLTNIEVDAAGVATSDPYPVDHLVLTGTLPVDTMQRLVKAKSGLTLTLTVSGGKLVAATKALGLDATATLVPRAQDGEIHVDVADVHLGGLAVAVDALPAGLRRQLTSIAVPITGLPAGIALSGVAVVDGGVRVTAVGAHVALAAAAAGATR